MSCSNSELISHPFLDYNLAHNVDEKINNKVGVFEIKLLEILIYLIILLNFVSIRVQIFACFKSLNLEF